MVGATTNDVKGQMAALRDLGALPADTDLDAVIRDLAPRPAADRPDDADRRGAGQGGPAGRQGAARLRRPDAEGADALRQEHGVPRRRDRPAGSRPRHPRRDRQHLDDCSRSATASGSAASSGIDPTVDRSSTSTASRPASASTPSVDRLTYRELQAAPRADPEADARPRPAASSAGSVDAVRLVIARCSVDYAGSALRPPARGDAADHGEGRRLRGGPRRRRRLQAAELDERAEHARRRRRPLGRHQPEGRDADDHAARGAHRRRPSDLGDDPGLQKDGVEAHLQELLAASPARDRGRAARWCAASTRRRSARSTSSAATAPARSSPSRSSAAARSTASSSSPATSSGCSSTRRSATSAACSSPSRSSRRPGCSPRRAASAGSRSTTTSSAASLPDDLRLF